MKELRRSSCADTVANPKKVLNNQDKGGGEKDADWILCKFTCEKKYIDMDYVCLLYTSPSPRDRG